MKLFRFSFAFLCLTVPVIAGEGAPGEAVKAAVQKLASAPNYSWRMTTATGGNSRFTPGPVEGKTIKGGCTYWLMNFGEHRIDAYLKNGQAAVKTDEGWSKQEDRNDPDRVHLLRPRILRHRSAMARRKWDLDGRKGPDGRKDGHRKGSKGGFLARRLLSMKAPAEIAADLAGKVTALKAEGDTVSGDLTTEAALELLTFGSHRREGGCPPEPANPKGSVKYWLKDGALQKMEIHLAATIPLRGGEVTMDHTTVVEIDNVGTTKVEVPAEAQKLLEPDGPAPNPSPRPENKPS